MLDCAKPSTDCFELKVSTVSRFQNIIRIDAIIKSASQEKENKILCVAMRKWEELQLTLDNSKSEKSQGYY